MPELDLMGLLQGQYRTYAGDLDATAQPVLGVTVGVVTAVEDEQHLGRVKVQLPLLTERVESAWAQVAQVHPAGRAAARQLSAAGGERRGPGRLPAR